MVNCRDEVCDARRTGIAPIVARRDAIAATGGLAPTKELPAAHIERIAANRHGAPDRRTTGDQTLAKADAIMGKGGEVRG